MNKQPTLDSREVAEMVDKQHDQLLRIIRGYVEILDNDPSAILQTADFFIPATYLDKQNQERPCYLITKKGCDMIANKMTGEKGVLFTATYVTKFDEMIQKLQQLDPFASSRQTIGEVANLIREYRLIAKDGKISLAQAIDFATQYLQAKGEPFPDGLAKLLLEKEQHDAKQLRQLALFNFEQQQRSVRK